MVAYQELFYALTLLVSQNNHDDNDGNKKLESNRLNKKNVQHNFW